MFIDMLNYIKSVPVHARAHSSPFHLSNVFAPVAIVLVRAFMRNKQEMITSASDINYAFVICAERFRFRSHFQTHGRTPPLPASPAQRKQ